MNLQCSSIRADFWATCYRLYKVSMKILKCETALTVSTVFLTAITQVCEPCSEMSAVGDTFVLVMLQPLYAACPIMQLAPSLQNRTNCLDNSSSENPIS